MTAGGGIMHEEMPQAPPDGHMEGFQLWVNLPAALKMSHPRYQDLTAAQIPEVRRDDGTVIRVVAGEVDGVRGAVTEIYAEPEYLDVSLPAGAQLRPAGAAGARGPRVRVRGRGPLRRRLRPRLPRRPRRRAAHGAADGGLRRRRRGARRGATAPRCGFLLVSGKPLGEPIARYGPFVMNTREEISIALRDLQNDTFVWRDDPEWAAKRRTWSPDTWER